MVKTTAMVIETLRRRPLPSSVATYLSCMGAWLPLPEVAVAA
jgi:hypothetical protein